MAAVAINAAAAVAAAAKPAARRKLFTLVLLAEPKPNFIAPAPAAAPALSCPLAPLSSSAAAAAISSSPYARLLLGLKKRGFGVGKWNGFGGKLDEGESPRQAAIREMKEESDVDLDPASLSKRAVILQEFVDDPCILEIHVYLASRCSGVPKESDEMRPAWTDLASIPYADMWADDQHWYPWLLDGAARRFRAHFLFENVESNRIMQWTATQLSADEQADMEKRDLMTREQLMQ